MAETEIMKNANGIDYIEDNERVQINMREVKKINEPICVIKLKNGNYKQPTKKELKLLEKMGVNNPCLGKAASNVKPSVKPNVKTNVKPSVKTNVKPNVKTIPELILKPSILNNNTTNNTSLAKLQKELDTTILDQQNAEKAAAKQKERH